MNILAIRSLADTALTIDLADTVGSEAAERVAAALAAIGAAIAGGQLPGAQEAAGAFCSVTVHYDCLETAQADLVRRIGDLLAPLQPGSRPAGRLWSLPCCYDTSFGLDLDELSRRLAMPAARIVELHASTPFFVYALGFMPGLPFLGDLPASLALPRRPDPRVAVPAGSVAIANRMSVIYPGPTPGGWHIIGRCPIPLFDAGRAVPALLAAGDRVRFDPIDLTDFSRIRRLADEGSLDPSVYQRAG